MLISIFIIHRGYDIICSNPFNRIQKLTKYYIGYYQRPQNAYNRYAT